MKVDAMTDELTFQPTHPCGVRPYFEDEFEWKHRFQPTHPCGVRREDPDLIRYPLASFNPRTPAGCDPRQ